MKQHITAKNLGLIIFGIFIGLALPYSFYAFTKAPMTSGYRDLEMKVDVAGNDILIWKTVISPEQQGKPGIEVHRHEYARVVIPLTEGVLQRRDNNGDTTDYQLTIGKPIFLPADEPAGYHTDENMGTNPIELIVVQFTQDPVTVNELTPSDLQRVMFK